MHIVARQRNEFERATYRRFISQFKPNQLLFIDESLKDERKIQRKFGRELRGKRLSHVGNFICGTRFSVLAAVSMDGIKGAHAIEGAYDTAGFEFAMETFVAPSIGSCANGEDCSVVVMDNCAIHKSDHLLRIIRERGGIATLLPIIFLLSFSSRPYSPDLNPIERCFGTAKKWMLRHRHMAERYPKRCFEIALFNVSIKATVYL
ncbi:predicted protein [Nematostella vectensis]|uniref:Tc1-like transposase DDE domain-containing protein n=1 Tax=Nematostella vectensis TaxID=45351 RepID=A7S9E0_NEMVE|nr:predicted protein [Nematostella vectensis]|eukprot:XP_001631717.1 predicted protein [Nematostella vectensis]